MGRSRGGLTTKIHALLDAEGRLIQIALTLGQAHDGTAAEGLLAHLKLGAILLADKAYDSNAIREQAQKQDVWANIPPQSNRKTSSVFSTFVYRYRNLVERFFNKLKQFRGIATDKTRTRRTSWPPSSWSQPAPGSAVISPRSWFVISLDLKGHTIDAKGPTGVSCGAQECKKSV
jgi:transposase